MYLTFDKLYDLAKEWVWGLTLLSVVIPASIAGTALMILALTGQAPVTFFVETMLINREQITSAAQEGHVTVVGCVSDDAIEHQYLLECQPVQKVVKTSEVTTAIVRDLVIVYQALILLSGAFFGLVLHKGYRKMLTENSVVP